jgi:hypothetical protein
MPLMHILKNKLLLQKHFHVQESAIDIWGFWMFEENIKLVNEIIEDEESSRKKQEQEQTQNMPNYGDSFKGASNFANNVGNFQMPKF